MLRGFYTAASGMISQQRAQEALSNNIANVNTPGYKADEAVLQAFPEMLIQQMGSNAPGIQQEFGGSSTNRPIGSLHTGVYVQEVVPDFSQGPIRETGMPTDLALVDGALPDETGGLFFTVENEAGDLRYTRNGHLTVDAAGFLTTNEGYYVLDDNENRIQTNGMDFTVSSNGQLQGDGVTANIGVTYIADAQALIKEADNLLTLTDDGTEAVDARQQGTEFSVLQHTLESANVDSTKTMSEMMSAYRMFEQNQQVLKAYDESMAKAVSEIARLG